MSIEKPRTMKETVDAVWFALFGFNSEDGLIRGMANMKADIADIKEKVPMFWTRQDHEQAHEAYVAEHDAKEKEAEEHGERRKVSFREWVSIGLATLMGLGLIAVTLFEHFTVGVSK